MAAGLVDITEKAAQKAKALLAQKGMPDGAIRVRVTAGGCSGMSYDLQPVVEPKPGDKVIEERGLRIFLDAKSVLFLAGTTLDYESTLMSQRFVFKNPNAKSSCSCGESFSV